MTLEEPPHNIIRNVKNSFGWDFSGLLARGKLRIVDSSIGRPVEVSNSLPTRVKPFTLSDFLAEGF